MVEVSACYELSKFSPVILLAGDGGVERRYEKESTRRMAVSDIKALSCHRCFDPGELDQCFSVKCRRVVMQLFLV